jgi:hypothetical protein
MVNSYLENLIGREVSNTVIIDFDGTIIRESKELLFNFQNEPPLEGVIEGLQKLKKNGYHIKIWSCRTSSLYPTEFRLMQIKMVEEYLKKYEIPYDSVLMIDKPFACAYVDSRSIKPEWDHIIEQLENLE